MLHTSSLLANAAIGNDSSILQDIHDPEKNIAIFQRDLLAWQAELDSMLSSTVAWKESGALEKIQSSLQVFFKTEHPNCPSLLGDIAQLLELFKEVSGADTFRVLLCTVHTDMCRKFHSDINDLRMLCTYVGPGTLWLPNDVVEKAKAHMQDSELPIDEQDIQKAGTGDVVILKGALYPGAVPVIHRSPSIEGNQEQRLMLRIDTKSFLGMG